MKVNNIPINPRWKISNPECTCKGKLDECIHCKYFKAEQSVPTENFRVNDDIRDKNGKVTKKQTRIINKVTLQLGRHGDVMGFFF